MTFRNVAKNCRIFTGLTCGLNHAFWSFERKTYTWRSDKSSYFKIRWISHEIRQISHEIWWISWNPLANLINQINSRKTLQFYAVQWEGYVSRFHEIHWISQNLLDFTKSTKFREICRISCEIRRISKDQQLPGIEKPMFRIVTFRSNWSVAVSY